MTIDLSRVRIYIRPGVTDMRKGASGLTAQVQEEMKGDAFSGNVYIFCNRQRKLLKAIWWDRTEELGDVRFSRRSQEFVPVIFAC